MTGSHAAITVHQLNPEGVVKECHSLGGREEVEKEMRVRVTSVGNMAIGPGNAGTGGLAGSKNQQETLMRLPQRIFLTENYFRSRMVYRPKGGWLVTQDVGNAEILIIDLNYSI